MVLTKEETLQVIGALSGTYVLMAKVFYGTGLRRMECLRLRVKDLDFA
jgi:integrase